MGKLAQPDTLLLLGCVLPELIFLVEFEACHANLNFSTAQNSWTVLSWHKYEGSLTDSLSVCVLVCVCECV